MCDEGSTAVDVWNRMQGRIDWDALPVMIELVGIDDIELLLVLLNTIATEIKERANGESKH